jgi:2-C-methyl-D-erythritol 2,4-cyclodiphosphate synthase
MVVTGGRDEIECLPAMVRTGIGFDSHRLVTGRKLILGGVDVPHGLGPEGHSDADVLCHAVADALLGAAALGDIGRHFPDTDPQWKDARSLDLLARVGAILRDSGFAPGNIDATVVAEQPKLAPFMDAMCANIAEALQMAAGGVSVKATTAEKMGPVGRREGIACLAVATVRQQD